MRDATGDGTVAGFPHLYRDRIRFADIDRLGHLNNVAYAVYLESARVAMMEDATPGSVSGIEHVNWTIVRLAIDYLAPGHYPAEILVGTRVTRLGSSSVGLEQEVLANGVLLARAESVCVWTDLRLGKSTPLPEAMRAGLAPYLVSPGSAGSA